MGANVTVTAQEADAARAAPDGHEPGANENGGDTEIFVQSPRVTAPPVFWSMKVAVPVAPTATEVKS
jgi:hypothetical protein